VQFPLLCGNLREQPFSEIWTGSERLREVRAIRAKHLSTCSSCSHLGSCTRCPGLAFMEGNMRGPSSADCEKSYLRTGVVTAGMLAASTTQPFAPHHTELVQIHLPGI
jgi:radical SAM protein with 4Fe4S-binding SPASM domain